MDPDSQGRQTLSVGVAGASKAVDEARVPQDAYVIILSVANTVFRQYEVWNTENREAVYGSIKCLLFNYI